MECINVGAQRQVNMPDNISSVSGDDTLISEIRSRMELSEEETTAGENILSDFYSSAVECSLRVWWSVTRKKRKHRPAANLDYHLTAAAGSESCCVSAAALEALVNLQ